MLSVALLLPVSCKKNNDNVDTRKYLDGVLILDGAYNFVELGEPYTFRVYGISHPLASKKEAGHRLGMYYKIDGLMNKADTLASIKTNPLTDPVDTVISLADFINTDTLGTFTLNVSIFPEDNGDYYISTRTVSITTIDYERSIPDLAFDETLPYVEDDRDLLNIPYNYAEAARNGNPFPSPWLTRNMAYMGYGRAYYNADGMSYLLGRYYTWLEALDACPDGWHLPSDEEWAAMANAVVGSQEYLPGKDFKGFARHLKTEARFNGKKMWEFWPDAPIDGLSGLKAIPSGYCNSSVEEAFLGYPDYCCFWTSDMNPDRPGQAYYRYIFSSEDDLKLGSADMSSMAMPVRCVMD